MSLLEEFLESVQFIPQEMQRSCLLIQEIDQKNAILEAEVVALEQQYLEAVDKGNKSSIDENNNLMEKIKQKHLKSIHYADEKINTINYLYEYVEKYIKQLDDRIKNTEEEQVSQEVGQLTNGKIKNQLTTNGSSPHKKRHVTNQNGNPQSVEKLIVPENNFQSENKVEKYCYCNKNNGGQMIGCDNKNCKLQWFHFECVGITQQPKGKWFCFDCESKKS